MEFRAWAGDSERRSASEFGHERPSKTARQWMRTLAGWEFHPQERLPLLRNANESWISLFYCLILFTIREWAVSPGGQGETH